jgi:hypothetical protein
MKWILPSDIISRFWIGQLTTLDANPHIPLRSTWKDQERAEQERRISVH